MNILYSKYDPFVYVSFIMVPFLLIGCTGRDSNTSNISNTPTTIDRTIKFADQEIELVQFKMPDGGSIFLIGKYEITNDQYAAFLKATGYDGSDYPSSKKQEPFFYNYRKDPAFTDYINGVPAGEGNHPACYLNWYHAHAFCKWLSAQTGKTVRLPSEKEWQFVAGGKEKRKYPWGNQWDSNRCNSAGPADGFAKSSPVGSFDDGATPEGVHDLAGNIWEWSNDKTLMGGPWCLPEDALTTDVAAKEDAHQANDKFGFRILIEE